MKRAHAGSSLRGERDTERARGRQDVDAEADRTTAVRQFESRLLDSAQVYKRETALSQSPEDCSLPDPITVVPANFELLLYSVGESESK